MFNDLIVVNVYFLDPYLLNTLFKQYYNHSMWLATWFNMSYEFSFSKNWLKMKSTGLQTTHTFSQVKDTVNLPDSIQENLAFELTRICAFDQGIRNDHLMRNNRKELVKILPMFMYLKKELYELIRIDESVFDFIQDTALDGLWYWDLEHPDNEWMNARSWTALGYNPDEMPHKSTALQNIINQDDLKVANENFTKHYENPNHPYDQVVRYTHKNGSTVWLRFRGLAIRDENGKVIRMLGAHQDIIEIKRTEQELIIAKEKAEESEAKYSTLFTLMSEMVVLHELVFDENGEPVNYRITAHKQAENELKLQNVLLKTQQEVSIDGILIVNEDDKIVSFNQRFKRFFLGHFFKQLCKNSRLMPSYFSAKTNWSYKVSLG